jgi:putative selenate reductase
MLKALTAEIRSAGCHDLAGYRTHRLDRARADSHRSTVAAYVAHIRGDGASAYHLADNARMPREVDHQLETFGCVACNLCITVCPNDAFFSVPTPPELTEAGVSGRQQYLVWAELCNECGNCMTFCPEDGDPAKVKPRLFTTPAVFDGRTGAGLLLEDHRVVAAREGVDHSADHRSGPDSEAPGSTTQPPGDSVAVTVGRLLSTTGGNPMGQPATPPTGGQVR